MEKYLQKLSLQGEIPVRMDKYFNLIYKKHVVAYTEEGAENITHNAVDAYKNIQAQLASSDKNNNVLLVGKVQSGKTSNLEMLTALAFDNGYNVMVINGGYDNSLLKQTSDRFIETFDIEKLSYEDEGPAIFTTGVTDESGRMGDISGLNDQMVGDILDCNKPIIIVSMKRPVAMRKINKVLRNIIDRSRVRALIIDDEGDQASLNTAKNKTKDASATYAAIKEMKNLLDNPLYLSVTATPQANIFLGDWSELRPDSIRLIRPGAGYNGIDTYHLYENDIIKIVSDDTDEDWEIRGIPKSLWDAVRYFIVASAIKRKRSVERKDWFSDMIIHSFREVKKQSEIYTSLVTYIDSMRASFEYESGDRQAYLQTFEQCYEDFVSENIKKEISFASLIKDIKDVIPRVDIILKNGIGESTQGNESLKWHKIYVGGDLLQRGLTFKNLITTYFTRWATSGGNMDTNLQRARWFGYRNKYIDLCKIFTTDEISQEFGNLAEIENDLWDQFADVERGQLKIDDILIQSENTKQSPTSKQRVAYEKVTFKKRWIKQRFLLADTDKIQKNDTELNNLIKTRDWQTTTVGSKIGAVTGRYAFFSSNALKKLITVINEVFDREPFQKKALLDLLGKDEIPVILIGRDAGARYRSVYEHEFKIKALLQGADSLVADKVTYLGDNEVVIDKDKINIQIHRILPGKDRAHPMKDKEQYVFAVYVPKKMTYFIKSV